MKIPSADTMKMSAVSHLRQLNNDEAADLLERCKLEVGDTGQRYTGTTKIGLNITLRCRAADLSLFKDASSVWGDLPTGAYTSIKEAIEAVLPAELTVHDLEARSLLVDRAEHDKTELERLVEAQIDLMIAVSTGGPRIQQKNDEYRERKAQIRHKLQKLETLDPNPFNDLWAWYARWSSGDLPTYQSRREYVRNLYRPLLEDLAGAPPRNPAEPSRGPTGWEKVDRALDKIITDLGKANYQEEYQTIGLLCRECLISLAQAVFDPQKHKASDGNPISKTDAYRMLEAYFSVEFAGPQNEALRRHAKASLVLANELQHKRTAQYKDAALCSEATRTVVNIVVITSGKHQPGRL
ncbi:MAG TPA: hypothetical protein VEF34_13935 [Syntrophobacteraceae bacterium]|nr:hypothetical protein [Syntrophobacteraceae bacterium]